MSDGRLLYRLKRRWRDGTTHLIYEPLELMERLAALVHPPRFNITRYYGIFAPAASLRAQVIPEAEAPNPPSHPTCQSGGQPPTTHSEETEKKRGHQPRNYPWAKLMSRVFELDVLACPCCGGRMRILTVSPQMASSSSRRRWHVRQPVLLGEGIDRYDSINVSCLQDREGMQGNTQSG